MFTLITPALRCRYPDLLSKIRATRESFSLEKDQVFDTDSSTYIAYENKYYGVFASCRVNCLSDSPASSFYQDRFSKEDFSNFREVSLVSFHMEEDHWAQTHLGAFNYALKAICDALQRVMDGEITRLIINVPPGYGKTLSSVWAFVSKGFVVNQRSRFIHLSFSQELVLDNSSKIKEILLSEEFQHFNPLSLRNDTKAKGLWRTDQGGGVRAVQMGGTVTGFRAGQMGEGFSGALIIDDAAELSNDIRKHDKSISVGK